MKMFLKGSFLAAGLAMSGAAAAAPVEPVSYSFDRLTDCGSYCYHDETGRQLIDGAYGVAGWAANIGSGPAYEWVGWVGDSPVNIDFNFGVSRVINQVRIGTTQDNVVDVVLPSVDVYQNVGSGWSLVGSLSVPESSANDNAPTSTSPHTFLDLSGLSINSQFVRVSLKHSFNGPWTFTDEVDFFGPSVSVPEPASLLLVAFGLAGMSRRKRKLPGV